MKTFSRAKSVALAVATAVAVLVLVIAVYRRPDAGIESARDRADVFAHQVMSPYCPGLLLANCRSEGARALRAEIVRRLESGEKPEAIEGDLVARFGDTIRTVHRLDSSGLIVWGVPLGFGLMGLAVVARFVRRRAGRGDATGWAGEADDPQLQSRLEDELNARD